jgi:hypothetical protein
MADTKISAMTPATTITGSEAVPLVQGGANVQATTSNLINQGLAVAPATSRTALGLGTLATASTASATQGGTGISTYTLGDTLYSSATNTLAKLAGNITAVKKFLSQTGTGSASAAPSWELLDPSDINTQYGAFHFNKGTTLSAQLQNNETTSMSVVSTADFASSGNVLIGTEVITYTGKTLTTLTGLTRAVAGTSAATHPIGSAVTSAQIAAPNTATAVRLNTTDYSNGVSVVSETQLTFAIGGTYNIAFSAQFLNASASVDNAAIWFQLSGVDIIDSCSIATVPKKDGSIPGAIITAANLFVTVTAGQNVQLYWSTATGNSILVTYPESLSAPVRPASPAVIVTVNQVS